MRSPHGHVLDGLWSSFLAAARREFKRSATWPAEQTPHFTEKNRWRLLPIESRSSWLADGTYEHGNWTAGFWFGVMWLFARGTKQSEVAALARDRLEGLAARATDSTTHDLGFLFYPSYVLGELLGFIPQGDAIPARQAARMLGRRFNPRGGYIQAFGSIGDDRTAGTSTIDTMMNLPLLWRTAHDWDPILFDVARLHARTSARLFIREDGSTYHLIRLDSVSGALVHRGTFQGASAESCWSRGQAWAVCGFAWAYAATGEPELLSAATRTAVYFWDHLPGDGVPPWDFSDTSSDAERDASASAIAAVGALILGRVHPEERQRTRHWTQATTLLDKLATCVNESEHTEGILARSCYSKPHGLGLTCSTAWGDFFFGLGLALAVGVVPLHAALGFRSPSVTGDEETARDTSTIS